MSDQSPVPQERWLPIAGYEGYYEVSDLGQVRGVDRVITRVTGIKERRKGIVLRQAICRHTGYYAVVLCRDRKPVGRTVHSLVAAAFVSNPHKRTEVDHKDRNRTHNVAANLRWSTRRLQALNTRQVPAGANPHRGVYFSKTGGYRRKWYARLGPLLIGRFMTKREAVLARRAAYNFHTNTQ